MVIVPLLFVTKIPILWHHEPVPKNAAHVSARLPFQAKMCINNLRHHFPQLRKNYGRTQRDSIGSQQTVWRIRGWSFLDGTPERHCSPRRQRLMLSSFYFIWPCAACNYPTQQGNAILPLSPCTFLLSLSEASERVHLLPSRSLWCQGNKGTVATVVSLLQQWPNGVSPCP